MCSFSMSLTTTKKPPFLAFSNTATTTTTGGAQDKTVYPSSEETFGTVKIMEDSLPMVSERNPDELSPWAHSSLRGKAFVARQLMNAKESL